MCDKAIKDDPSSLQFVPDWFVSQQQLDVWYDDLYWYNDDDITECYEGYKKPKAQKPKIKEEFLSIAWHPSRYLDWCVPKDEKKRQKNYWHKKWVFLFDEQAQNFSDNF